MYLKPNISYMIRFLSLLLSLWAVMAYGQQIPLKGIVTVQNSRVNTGKTEYVSEVSISHPNAKPTATDSRGAFTLQILRLKSGAQTAIEVKPTGRYKEYIVVDERLIKDITLGRTTPISICIQDRRILEEREKRLIAVTVKKQNEIRERKIAELNKRIAALEEANDYANEQYQKSIDSLTLLANDKAQAIKRIREYAKDMVLINLDEADSIYRRAYQFFEEGELDSVASYLRRHINFEEESKQIQQQLGEAQEEKSLARELDKQADQKIANAKDAEAQLLKKLLLAAKANAELYNYNEAEQYYEQALALARSDGIRTIKYFICLNEYTNYIKTYTKRIEEETKRVEEETKQKEEEIKRVEEKIKQKEGETKRMKEYLEKYQTSTLLPPERPGRQMLFPEGADSTRSFR